MSADVFAGVASTIAVGLMGLLVYGAYKFFNKDDENGNLRDLNEGLKAQLAEVIKDRDTLKVDNDRLRLSGNTSERLLVAANARIAELVDEAATKAKEQIDVATGPDLVELSHKLLSSSAASDPAAPGDDHGPSSGVPHPSETTER